MRITSLLFTSAFEVVSVIIPISQIRKQVYLAKVT